MMVHRMFHMSLLLRYHIAHRQLEALLGSNHGIRIGTWSWHALSSLLRSDYGSSVARRRIFIFLVHRDVLRDIDLQDLVNLMGRDMMIAPKYSWHLGF